MKIKAYAKINLALEVMDIENGYHKVNNLMIPIDLYDEIDIFKDDLVYVVDDPFPDENIMVKAANLFFSYTNIKGGVRIEIKKNIPSAAGLAGGSSDAASILKGLNVLYDAKLSKEELIDLSSKLGSDVGFFIIEEVALCTGRGEIVNNLNIKTNPISLVLIKPKTSLSTAYVYKKYIYDGISKESKINNIIKALKNNDITLLKNNIFNDLEPIALKLNKELNDIYNMILSFGIKPYVSGSGPTIFLLNENKDILNKIKEKLDNDTFYYEGFTK